MTETSPSYNTGTSDSGDETVYRVTPAGDGPPQVQREQWSNGGTVTLAGYVAGQPVVDAANERALLRITLAETQAEVERLRTELAAARPLADHALMVWRHWPVRVGGTVTAGLYAALQALHATAERQITAAPDG